MSKQCNLTLEQKKQKLQPFGHLLLLYLIPKNLLALRKLDEVPRNPLVVATDPRWREFYFTTGFTMELADLWAQMMWPLLQIRGDFNHYSINHPIMRLVVDLSMWEMLLYLLGGSIDDLAMVPEDGEIDFPSKEKSFDVCTRLAYLLLVSGYYKVNEIMEVVWKHRDHRDYAVRSSSVKSDFLRHYYPFFRNQYDQISLQDAEGAHELVVEENFDVEDVVTTFWMQEFFDKLKNEKDVTICKLLFLGLKQAEIASHMGYANHSGVCKKIAKIRRKLKEYLDWQITLEREQPQRRLPSTVKYDIIPFSYRRTTEMQT